PAQLTTLTRRAELAEELGVDVFLVVPFTPEFMKLSPERYVHELLVERLHVAEVVVGENFTFGKKAAGNVHMLKKAGERFGFKVDAVTLVTEHAVTFSSTYIRSCVDAGDMVAATEALGPWFTLLGHGPTMGTVVPGERYQAAVSVGSNPTFSGKARTVEAFIMDTAADLYGQHVAVDFVARVRSMEKFDSVDDLIVAMGKDAEKART
ncbi:Riboflavin kinase like protein, partial [Aduncisulcus paluster]